MESSFQELRCKEVVNVVDGKKLGHIIDIVFDLQSGRICGFVVPGFSVGWNFFKTSPEIFVPYSQVCKIGEDIILVELFSNSPGNFNNQNGTYICSKASK